MSYCHIKCLKMILDYKKDLRPLPFLECVSTSPFGFVYAFTDRGGFAVDGFNPHKCVGRALDALGYQYDFRCFGSSRDALAFLKESLKEQPVIIGPIDLGFRTYDPMRRVKRGADHYIVGLGIEDSSLIANDPDGYPLASFPLADLLKAWKADLIDYRVGPYSMWIVKQKVRETNRYDLYVNPLRLGLQNLREKRTERFLKATLYHGSEAISRLALDVKQYRRTRWLRLYSNFSFQVSGQRCFDSASFIRESPIKNEDMAAAFQTRIEQAKLYGEAQLYAATKHFGRLSNVLLSIAADERQLEVELGEGLFPSRQSH
jgi:hypothetical protein